MPFSRKHYLRVSPPDETPRDVAIRFASLVWFRAAVADMERAYPITTPANFVEANDFRDQRYRELLAIVGLR